MPQRTLRFRIRQDGRVEESVTGVLGESCQVLTEKLEAALGSVEVKHQTADAFRVNQEENQSISTELN